MARSRSVSHVLVISVASLVIFILMGLLVKTLSDWYGYATVANRIEAFAEQMQIIRPLVLLVAFCFWNSILNSCVQTGLLASVSGNRLVTCRNRLFCWVVLLELSLGQGQLVIAAIALAGILIYYWATNPDKQSIRK